jgi:hypothetical protein
MHTPCTELNKISETSICGTLGVTNDELGRYK